MLGEAEVVEASDCGSDLNGFESHRPTQRNQMKDILQNYLKNHSLAQLKIEHGVDFRFRDHKIGLN
jgi:hypothetical protein